ncbi:MAG: hypothetical protein A3B94_02910 [Candidatus Jacksonbacteria bacterium RIFCSPHIGHO2_02_FULL_43_10]|nr:MAG: hypothetical protein A3B94_02910 [Candidatus Jacksonbacteria bacterium RIFCSPHIGHO2_02_FULL_43_10]
MNMLIKSANQHLWARIRAGFNQYKPILYPYILLMVRELERLSDDAQNTRNTVVHRRQLIESILSVFEHTIDEQTAAFRVNKLLGHHRIDKALTQRACLIAEQITPHIPPTSRVLSFGCGDGQVDWNIQNQVASIQLYDVADYRQPHVTLPFTTERKRLGNDFDVATLIAVWHHCIDYQDEISWITKRVDQLVVIESVLDDIMPWEVQAAIDWLYNRGMNAGANIPVPGHFHTVQEWEAILAKHGFAVGSQEDYGIDIPLVPEHHVLMVFNKQ